LRVLVISDTHDNLQAINAFCERIGGEGVDNYDLLIHLGDIISPFSLRAIQGLGIKVIGVFGNNDGDRVLLKRFCPELSGHPMQTDIGGLKALLMHGWGGRDVTESMVNALAASGAFDVILYGHTHIADARVINDTLVLNPGALSGYLAERQTYAVLDIERGRAALVDLQSGRVIREVLIPK